MIKINKSNIKIDSLKIDMFENEIGKRLPNDYYDFLLKYNGGVPENNIYENSEISITVQIFYGLELNDIKDIRHKSKILKNRIPKDCIPIAEIEGGDVLCLELSRQNYGRILLWEHEEELNESYTDNVNMLKKVTSTFTEFMERLAAFDVDINDDDFKVKEIWIDPEFLKELNNN